MNTYITTSGIGTEIREINIQGLVALIDKTTNLKKKILLEGINLSDENLALEDFEKFDTPNTIMEECLNEIANVEAFRTVEDDDGCHYILFQDMAPWEYTMREKNLSRKDVKDYLLLLIDVLPDMEVENLYIANYIAG